jgi:hypothetical protein
MAISIKHTFQTTKPDDPAHDVSKDEWNEEHTISGIQDQSDRLDDIAALAVADGNFLVANGITWVVESGATVRTSLGLVAGGAGDIWVEKAGDTMSGSGNTSLTIETTTSGNTTNLGLKNPGRTWSLNVRGDLSDSFSIRDETAGSVNRLTIDSSGNVEVIAGTLTIPDLFTVNQAGDENNANDRGIRINGFDDQSGAFFKFGIGSNGRVRINSSNTIELRVNNVRVNDIGQVSTNYLNRFRAYVEFQWGSGANYSSIYQSSDDKLYFAYGSVATTDPFMVADNSNNVIFGGTTPAAQVHIDQNSTTAALPVLYLDQADISEELIQAASTAGVGNAIELVGAKTFTLTEFWKVTSNGNTRYIQVGTIA